MEQEPISLTEMLDILETSTDERDYVSLGMILERLGRRSFGPVLLFAGLVILAPLIGDIPGVPTIMALLVLLTAGQLLIRREYFWMPDWMLARSMNRDKFCKALGWLRPVARFIDRFTRPRLTQLTQDIGSSAIALMCILIAAFIPVMEMVPFSANIAGIGLFFLGLALTARDGLLALIALVFVGMATATVIYIIQ